MPDVMFFDRLPVFSENHRQGGLRDDLAHRFADHRFEGQPGGSQKCRVDRNEAELPFGFHSQVENDIPDSVVDRHKTRRGCCVEGLTFLLNGPSDF